MSLRRSEQARTEGPEDSRQGYRYLPFVDEMLTKHDAVR
jgi:hypothetical protein